MLKVKILTPERIVFSAVAESVVIPSTTGIIEVLPGHASLFTGIFSGILDCKNQKESLSFAIHHGFSEIDKDEVSILIKICEEKGKLDLERAIKAEKKVREMLEKIKPDADEFDKNFTKLQSKLMRSLTRQKFH